MGDVSNLANMKPGPGPERRDKPQTVATTQEPPETHPGQQQADGTAPSTLGKPPTRQMGPSSHQPRRATSGESSMSGMEIAMQKQADRLHPS